MTTDTSRIDASPDALLKLAEECECHDACMDTTAETLRAIAAEKRAAEDGVTDEVVAAAKRAYYRESHDDKRLRVALKSAALAMQSKDAQRLLLLLGRVYGHLENINADSEGDEYQNESCDATDDIERTLTDAEWAIANDPELRHD